MIDLAAPSPKAQLIVDRNVFSATTTISDLILRPLSLARFCFTLEDTVRAGADGVLQAGEKVDGKTAIPSGIFELELDVSSRFGFCPFIMAVPLFEDVRMHWGNDAASTSGCVLVGKTKADNFIGESREAFKDLMMELVPMRRLERIYIEVCGGPSAAEMLGRAA